MKPLTEQERKIFATPIRRRWINPDAPDWHSFTGTWLRKHPKGTRVIYLLEELLNHAPNWEDLTDDVLSDLVYDMKLELAPNSVQTYCKQLTAVLNMYGEAKSVPSLKYDKALKAKKEPTQAVYLTQAELRTLHEFQPITERHKFAKELFMRECLTGARSSDSRLLSEANIHSEDGVEYITYVATKHPVEVTVPVHRWLREYLHEWPDELMSLRPDSLNRDIRMVCKHAGINRNVSVFRAGQTYTGPKYKFIASHTGRRTFATLLFLKNCPLEQIAILMGHVTGNTPNITMTAGYICEKAKITRRTVSLFK